MYDERRERDWLNLKATGRRCIGHQPIYCGRTVAREFIERLEVGDGEHLDRQFFWCTIFGDLFVRLELEVRNGCW